MQNLEALSLETFYFSLSSTSSFPSQVINHNGRLRVRGRARGNSHIKRRVCWLEILERTPKRNQDPVLRAWFEIRFSPKRYQFLHKILSPVIFRKSSRCGPFEAKHPKRYQNCVFNA